MRVGVVADVHLGNHRLHGGPVEAGVNRRAREVAATLKRAAAAAVEAGCQRFVIAGDLFDAAKPSPQIVRLCQEALAGKLPTYVEAGNHDIESSLPGDNALGPLRAMPNVVVVERPAVHALAHADLLLVPFQPGDARQWLGPALASLVPDHRRDREKLLVTHLGIVDESTQPFLRGAHDAVDLTLLLRLCGELGIGDVVAGNWHSARFWPVGLAPHRGVAQCGALAPTGWDNPGPDGYGSLWVWDEGSGPQVTISGRAEPPSLARVEIPGPRFFEVFDFVGARRAAESQRAGNSVYVRWKVGPEASVTDAQATLDRWVAAGEIAAGEALEAGVDHAGMARAAAISAAHAAGRAGGSGLDEALAAFVGQMEVAEGVDRAEVLARARGFLASG